MNPNTLRAIELAITLLNLALEAMQNNAPITNDELDAKQKEVDAIVEKIKKKRQS